MAVIIDKNYMSNLYSHLKSNEKLNNEQEILDILKSVLYCLRADGRLYSKEYVIEEIVHFFEIYSEDSTPLDKNYINKTIAPNIIKYGVFNESVGRSYIQIIDKKIEDEREKQEWKRRFVQRQARERARAEEERKAREKAKQEEQERMRLEERAKGEAASISLSIQNKNEWKYTIIAISVTIIISVILCSIETSPTTAIISCIILVIACVWAMNQSKSKTKEDIEEWKQIHPNDLISKYL